jgi:hypothetical protein
MTLHIFNPEHDIALAANLANFTAPHAGRQLRADLDFLPALWAQKDDRVLVENPEHAAKQWKRLLFRLVPHSETGCFSQGNKLFLPWEQVVSAKETTSIEPWGWDLALKAMLKRKGTDESLLPSDADLGRIRQLSHRRTSACLLPFLQMEGTVGEAYECTTEADVEALLHRYGQVVTKAPWSSSGRGVRFDSKMEWVRHVIQRQGSIMVEPFYHKAKDFGMEFTAEGGVIRYEGLSLFVTRNGAYIGNMIAAERVKRQTLSRYVSLDLLDRVRDQVLSRLDLSGYEGPFGIDMMIVKGGLLHPCVEINLRRTMGHVALSIGRLIHLDDDDSDNRRIMRIDYDGSHYKLRVLRRTT